MEHAVNKNKWKINTNTYIQTAYPGQLGLSRDWATC